MNSKNTQQGQTLIIILILMIIALGIGIAISQQFITRSKMLVGTDNAQRALSIAESAIEHLLILPITTLETYAANGTCTTDCILEITGSDGQVMRADVTLSNLGSSTEPYLLDVKQTETGQVNLMGYPENTNLNVCWRDADMAITAIYIYGQIGTYLAESYSYNSTTPIHPENNFETAVASLGYENCFSFVTQANSAMLRLKPVYSDGIVAIIPDQSASIPNQGVLIEAKGTAGDAVKFVDVLITDQILPSIFDYVLYQKSVSEPLSN